MEHAIDDRASLAVELRLDTLQMAAMISLLLEGWFEPPSMQGMRLSTLVQQILSFIAQNGGATIGQLYTLLCAPAAPFASVGKTEFVDLIRHLGQKELLMQDASGVLLHGRVGEKLVSRAPGGAPPLFSGGVGRIHTRVRQRMRQLLESADVPPYLDTVAQRLLAEGRATYRRRNLAAVYALDQGREALLLTWLGDAANEAIACLLRRRGFIATPAGPGVEVLLKDGATLEQVIKALSEAGRAEIPALDELLADTRNLQREKWDWALPDHLLRCAYGSLYLDLDEALRWIRTLGVIGT